MKFRFDPTRTTQAVGVIMASNQGIMIRSRLMLLLYLADRELLIATGRTLTGDSAVATNHGPLLKQTRKLLKGFGTPSGDGEKFLESHGGEVVLKADPGRRQLTPREVEKLGELLDRFRGVSTCGIAALTRGLPEYTKNFVPDGVESISWSHVLQATVADPTARSFEASHDEQAKIDSIFEALTSASG